MSRKLELVYIFGATSLSREARATGIRINSYFVG